MAEFWRCFHCGSATDHPQVVCTLTNKVSSVPSAFTQMNISAKILIEQCDFYLRGVEAVWHGFQPIGNLPLALNTHPVTRDSTLGNDLSLAAHQRGVTLKSSPSRHASRVRSDSPASIRTPRGQSPSGAPPRGSNFTDFSRACKMLNQLRNQAERRDESVRILVEGSTKKEQQRIACLGLLGWDLSDTQLRQRISKSVSQTSRPPSWS